MMPLSGWPRAFLLCLFGYSNSSAFFHLAGPFLVSALDRSEKRRASTDRFLEPVGGDGGDAPESAFWEVNTALTENEVGGRGGLNPFKMATLFQTAVYDGVTAATSYVYGGNAVISNVTTTITQYDAEVRSASFLDVTTGVSSDTEKTVDFFTTKYAYPQSISHLRRGRKLSNIPLDLFDLSSLERDNYHPQNRYRNKRRGVQPRLGMLILRQDQAKLLHKVDPSADATSTVVHGKVVVVHGEGGATSSPLDMDLSDVEISLTSNPGSYDQPSTRTLTMKHEDNPRKKFEYDNLPDSSEEWGFFEPRWEKVVDFSEYNKVYSKFDLQINIQDQPQRYSDGNIPYKLMSIDLQHQFDWKQAASVSASEETRIVPPPRTLIFSRDVAATTGAPGGPLPILSALSTKSPATTNEIEEHKNVKTRLKQDAKALTGALSTRGWLVLGDAAAQEGDTETKTLAVEVHHTTYYKKKRVRLMPKPKPMMNLYIFPRRATLKVKDVGEIPHQETQEWWFVPPADTYVAFPKVFDFSSDGNYEYHDFSFGSLKPYDRLIKVAESTFDWKTWKDEWIRYIALEDKAKSIHLPPGTLIMSGKSKIRGYFAGSQGQDPRIETTNTKRSLLVVKNLEGNNGGFPEFEVKEVMVYNIEGTIEIEMLSGLQYIEQYYLREHADGQQQEKGSKGVATLQSLAKNGSYWKRVPVRLDHPTGTAGAIAGDEETETVTGKGVAADDPTGTAGAIAGEKTNTRKGSGVVASASAGFGSAVRAVRAAAAAAATIFGRGRASGSESASPRDSASAEPNPQML